MFFSVLPALCSSFKYPPDVLGVRPQTLDGLLPLSEPTYAEEGYFYDFSSSEGLLDPGVDLVTVETRADRLPAMIDYTRDECSGEYVFSPRSLHRPPAERLVVLKRPLGPARTPFPLVGPFIQKVLLLWEYVNMSPDPDRLLVFFDSSDVVQGHCEGPLRGMYPWGEGVVFGAENTYHDLQAAGAYPRPEGALALGPFDYCDLSFTGPFHQVRGLCSNELTFSSSRVTGSFVKTSTTTATS
jgi:hypothetical protein